MHIRPSLLVAVIGMVLLGLVGMYLDYEQAALVVSGGLVSIAAKLVDKE